MQMESLGERIQFIQHKLGGSNVLQQMTGISASQQSRLIRNEIKSPGLGQITAIASAAGVTLDWLAIGKGESDGIQSASGYVALPLIGSESGKAPFLLERSFLIHVLGVSVDKAVIYHEISDCMEPEVKKGSYMVIKTGIGIHDGMFLVKLKGREQMFLRYIQLNPENSQVEVSAAKGNYKTFSLPASEIEIVGLPVWFGAR